MVEELERSAEEKARGLLELYLGEKTEEGGCLFDPPEGIQRINQALLVLPESERNGYKKRIADMNNRNARRQVWTSDYPQPW